MKNSRKDMLVVDVRGGDIEESTKQAIRLFMKKVRNSGVMQEVLDRRYYEKPSVKRKKKHIRAIHGRIEEDDDFE